MASARAKSTNTKWGVEFDTVRREKLFRDPPKDHSAYPALQEVVRPHIDSFNAIFEDNGLMKAALEDIGTKTFIDGIPETPKQRSERILDRMPKPKLNRLSVKIQEIFLEKSVLPEANKHSRGNREILPAECRERNASYRGRLRVRLCYRVNNEDWKESLRDLGFLPILLKSNRCHLEKCTPAQLIEKKEETEELGGYFVVNGIEKIIRLLIVAKRNYPMAIMRPSFRNRGPLYSQYGIQIRSVRPDQTSQTNVLHYLNDGNVTFRFSWRKNEYLIPVMMILNALVETNDYNICQGLVGTSGSGLDNTFLTDRVELLLRTYKTYETDGELKRGKSNARAYIGSKFRVVLGITDNISDEDCGTEFLRCIVLPHLGNVRVTESQDRDKFRMLLFMIRKLYALVAGDCAVDNPDAVSNQEVLLGGFLYGMILKEKLDEWLGSIGIAARDWSRRNGNAKFDTPEFSKNFSFKIVKRTNENIGALLEYFLSTGNLVSSTGLDLQQVSGYTVVAEKINFYRFLSHFRMVHRGSFFAQLKTTTVRKLLPESWGFLCPVHTPDGSPCGLLNHLAHKCLIPSNNLDVSALPEVLASIGVEPFTSMDESVVVQLDGRIMGFCSPKEARAIADRLRYWKVEGKYKIPLELEIGYVPSSNGGQYPGIYMFSQAARMIRPVKYLPTDKLDYVGPFEQPFMDIACTTEDIISSVSTHCEIDPTNILSILANMTPFSDFNQSPRNMYQCQMSKQTMGTPSTAIRYRADNKLYRLQSGHTPIVRAPLHNEYGLDNFPNGTNAIVAVIAYTGYDMDDAMIINKSAHERGFAHGTIYKTKFISLEESKVASRGKASISKLFGFAPKGMIKAEWRAHLDEDGLPHIGHKISQGDIICAEHTVTYDHDAKQYINQDGQTNFHRYKDSEEAYVEEVRLLGSEAGNEPCQTISIKIRISRPPLIGDKFASRHGQKGVCSQKYPMVDMPFSESGMTPDIIINPHAFPSRMTIGMLIESLAGKAGACHGIPQDCTPWQFDEENTAADYFGHQLMKAGYNYNGNEPMYSGITGREFRADIYLGVVYYQRLRHMVNDKYQVRTTGPNDGLTGQPIKGRAKGGGIRVGEMERDALLAHGTAFLIQDRLMNCSDYTQTWICRSCGCFLGIQPVVNEYSAKRRGTGPVRCRLCAKKAGAAGQMEEKEKVWSDGSGGWYTGGEDTTMVAVPGVLRYLDAEFAAMGMKMRFHIEP
ncbi:MAG: DNA-directed RNA polymerase I subunit RPA2 [Cirrosporium novae-zelandiae]|nr:MAG: DNA-directed RNA polymerase I subunit RPA2 [Cirrosporium novae-zelandiae]